MLEYVEEIAQEAVVICPNGTRGNLIEIADLPIILPKQPQKMLFDDLPIEQQYWRREEPPKELMKIKSMDEFKQLPKEMREKYSPYIKEQYQKRKDGVWFMNYGTPTYLTPDHWMLLQWTKTDIGYSDFYHFQWKLHIHDLACEKDPRCFGQIYTKCRRSGFTVMKASKTINRATSTKNKLLGVMSKTGDDAKENVFLKRIVAYYQSYPFFFKPIQDGSTNPRNELAFRTPAKMITVKNKVATRGEGLNTVINWKNTTINAYDGEKLDRFLFDEAAKVWPENIQDIWRIHRTCLVVGRNIIGKANLGSTINPLDKGGANFKKIWDASDPTKRNDNGMTASGLYRIFIPAYEALEGFFDKYGYCVIHNPERPIMGMDGKMITIGAKTYLDNNRRGMERDPYDYNEYVRQYPYSEMEAFTDSMSNTAFNITKINQQLAFNESLVPIQSYRDVPYPNVIVRGNFVWQNGVKDSVVSWSPDPLNGRWIVYWLPPQEMRNAHKMVGGKRTPANDIIGVAGIDTYDIDATTDGRGSKGACHLFNKFNMVGPSNCFVAEYAERPNTAADFYEDMLMALVFYGYQALVENNKYGIVRYFENRGYDNYLMDRPAHLTPKGTKKVSIARVKGVPTSSEDIVSRLVESIEAFIHEHVGVNDDTGEYGNVFFTRTLHDWRAFKPDDRTKYDLSISSGMALLGAQKIAKQRVEDGKSTKLFREFRL